MLKTGCGWRSPVLIRLSITASKEEIVGIFDDNYTQNDRLFTCDGSLICQFTEIGTIPTITAASPDYGILMNGLFSGLCQHNRC